MTIWSNPEAAGFLPQIISDHDGRSVQEQVNDRYQHGGGWHSFNGYELSGDAGKYFLLYPEDAPLVEVSRARFHDQLLVLFQYSMLAYIEDGELIDVARMD